MKEIQLRRLRKSDIFQIAKLANNKKVWDNLRDFIPYPYTESDAVFFVTLTEKENPEQTFGIITDEDELCGVIGLVIQSDVYRLSAEIGYWVGEEYWGRGIATKAIGLITHYGFEKLNLERIHTGVYDFNIASMKALGKNGYQKEGVFRNSVIKNGNICDEHRYAKLRSD
ncbi:GNAT family N-acetyltransferase [Saprospiraceae bacterium]|nr:GNAT family N-acetyltransferase [Saprospiraceae bacterium]